MNVVQKRFHHSRQEKKSASPQVITDYFCFISLSKHVVSGYLRFDFFPVIDTKYRWWEATHFPCRRPTGRTNDDGQTAGPRKDINQADTFIARSVWFIVILIAKCTRFRTDARSHCDWRKWMVKQKKSGCGRPFLRALEMQDNFSQNYLKFWKLTLRLGEENLTKRYTFHDSI